MSMTLGIIASTNPLQRGSRPTPVFSIRKLTTAVPGAAGPLVLVDDVSLDVGPGETLAVVGESGSGKTMTFLSSIRLLPRQGRILAGQVVLDGQDLVMGKIWFRSMRRPSGNFAARPSRWCFRIPLAA
jgi:ABC-type glutathione transport system ATPase component